MPRQSKTHFSHPGAILKREFLDEIGLRPGTLARLIGVDRSRVRAIIEGNRDITADTALRLGKFLGTTPDFWMNLQSHYNLAVASDGAKHEISQIHPWRGDARIA